jgi:hypothetical protein
MKVETYEEKECYVELDEKGKEEVAGLINTLRLKGQESLLTKDGGRCPYREMTSEEFFVYEKVCPTKQKVEEYDGGPIPLRVLQIVSHAREFFDHMLVWHAGRGNPDPVLAGYKTPGGKAFLLARWGTELEEFPILRKCACDVYRSEYKVKCAEYEATMSQKKNRELTDGECFVTRIPWLYE